MNENGTGVVSQVFLHCSSGLWSFDILSCRFTKLIRDKITGLIRKRINRTVCCIFPLWALLLILNCAVMACIIDMTSWTPTTWCIVDTTEWLMSSGHSWLKFTETDFTSEVSETFPSTTFSPVSDVQSFTSSQTFTAGFNLKNCSEIEQRFEDCQ